MKRRIIPPTTSDKFLAITSLIGASYSIYWLVNSEWYYVIPNIIIALGGILSAYVYQDQPRPKSEDPNEYLEIISRLKDMGKQIESMSVFMEKEKKRIIEAKETLNQLLAEKKDLQPIVETHRDTVDAILEAHSKSTKKRQWKERLLSFIFGIFASMIAAYGYSFIDQKPENPEINPSNKAIQSILKPLGSSEAADEKR